MNYLFIGPLLLDSFIVNLLHTELGVAASKKYGHYVTVQFPMRTFMPACKN